MEFPLLIFAILGFLAAARLAGRAGFRLLTRGVEVFLVSEAGRTHAQRGDITALRDADVARRSARRKRLGALVVFAGCVGLLAVPPFTPWPTLVYASYAPLWLLPPRRIA
jgi:hypothetical protein